MNAQLPPRRPRLQRPGALPSHPYAVPVADDDEPPEAPAAPPPAPEPDPAPVQQPAAEPAGETSRRAGERRRKPLTGQVANLVFDTQEDFERVKRAYAARGLREGYPSLNTWLCDVVLAATADLEERFNGGNPFTEADSKIRRRRGRG